MSKLENLAYKIICYMRRNARSDKMYEYWDDKKSNFEDKFFSYLDFEMRDM